MKKEYMKPQVEVVKVNIKSQLLAGSPYATSVDGNVFEGSISGGNGGGRSRGYNDDDWDE